MMTHEETLAFNQRLWHDAAFRKSQIDQVQLRNALVRNIFMTARSSGLSELVATEVAMIALSEESEFFQNMAVEAIGRAGAAQTRPRL